MPPSGVSQSALAKQSGAQPQRTLEIIRGRRTVTPDTTLHLRRYSGMESQFLLNLRKGQSLERAKDTLGGSMECGVTHRPAQDGRWEPMRQPRMVLNY